MNGLTGRLKVAAAGLLEAHPVGYWLGVRLLTSSNLLLPHEDDYHGFARLAPLFPGSVLDLGANQGHSGRAFLKLLPGRDVLSVEANPFHRPRLEAVRRRHPRFDFRIAAVGDTAGGELELFTPSYGRVVCHSAAATTLDEARAGIEGSWPRLARRFRYHRSTTPTVTVDALGVEPGFIKLDIQGMEVPALEGAAATLARCRPALLVEVVNHLPAIRRVLAARDYVPFDFHPRRGAFTPAGAVPRSRNLFFVPVERAAAVPRGGVDSPAPGG